MTVETKRRLAKWGLGLGVFLFVLGGFLACHCPLWWLVVAAVSGLAISFGSPLQRVTGVLLCLLSITASVAEYRGEQRFKKRILDRIELKTPIQPK